MNKPEPSSVPPAVRMILLPTLAFFYALFATGCSASRTIAAEQELPVGNHIAKTVIDSDLFVPQGATLVVDYSRANRFFVESGGALTGFPKGARNTTVFAEEGAVIPDTRRQRGFLVRTVEDAEETFRNRYAELPPVGVGQGVPGVAGTATVVGVGAGAGFWGGGWGFWPGAFRGAGRSSRAVSVRPSSYRIRD